MELARRSRRWREDWIRRRVENSCLIPRPHSSDADASYYADCSRADSADHIKGKLASLSLSLSFSRRERRFKRRPYVLIIQKFTRPTLKQITSSVAIRTYNAYKTASPSFFFFLLPFPPFVRCFSRTVSCNAQPPVIQRVFFNRRQCCKVGENLTRPSCVGVSND